MKKKNLYKNVIIKILSFIIIIFFKKKKILNFYIYMISDIYLLLIIIIIFFKITFKNVKWLRELEKKRKNKVVFLFYLIYKLNFILLLYNFK